MSTEQNKAVVSRFIEEVLTKQNIALVDEILAPDYVNHLVPGGREAFKQFIPMLRSAAPDLKLRYDIEHMVAEADYVMARFTMHYANAGKEVSGSGVTEYRVVSGKIVEDWPPSDGLALLQQVGVALPAG
jgi:predicted SnoaL-like aldol condensation-catalyzing enzyme